MASGAKIRTAGFAALPLLQDLVEFRTIENRAMFFWVFTRAVHMAVIALTCDASFWAECFPVRVNRAANLSAFRCKNKLSLFLKKSIFFNFSQIFLYFFLIFSIQTHIFSSFSKSYLAATFPVFWLASEKTWEHLTLNWDYLGKNKWKLEKVEKSLAKKCVLRQTVKLRDEEDIELSSRARSRSIIRK